MQKLLSVKKKKAKIMHGNPNLLNIQELQALCCPLRVYYLTPSSQRSYEVGVIRPMLQTRKLSHADDNKAELGLSPRGYLTLTRQVGGGQGKRRNPWTI